jgi:hypothetical protein
MTKEPREVQQDTQVLEGADHVPHQPASPVDPYTPETHARPGESRARSAIRVAWIPVLIGIGLLIWAAVR